MTLTPELPLVLSRISPISEVKHFGQLLLSWAVAAVPEAAAQMLLNTFPKLTCQPQCCFMASITRAGQLFILSGAIIKALYLISVFFSVPSASEALSFFTHLCCVCRDHQRPESREHLLSPLCSTWWMPSWAVGYWVWHMLWQTLEWLDLRKNAQFPSYYSLIVTSYDDANFCVIHLSSILLTAVASLAGYSIHLLLKLCDQTGERKSVTIWAQNGFQWVHAKRFHMNINHYFSLLLFFLMSLL